MKILFYVEPHPIRGSLTHFRDVARKFLSYLSEPAIFDGRMFANDQTLASIPAEELAQSERKIIRTTPKEEADFASSLGDWDCGRIESWKQLMVGGTTADGYYALLRRLYQTFPFDVIVHWGENGAITKFASEHSVTRIAMELGCTRPPFMASQTMDAFGTNGAGIIPRLTMAEIRAATGDMAMSRSDALAYYTDQRSGPAAAFQFPPLSQSFSSELYRHRHRRLAFLPLQLADDANLILFSKYKSVIDAVLDVVPKLHDHGYTTIIRPHPASAYRRQAMVANTMARSALNTWADRIIWCDPQNDLGTTNAQLIQLAEFTVTVNSSVGFEATYFDKPVVVMGDAVYKPKDMFPTLEQFLGNSFNPAKYTKDLGHLREFMLGAYLTPDSESAGKNELLSRAIIYTDLKSQSISDPALFAKHLYQERSREIKSQAQYRFHNEGRQADASPNIFPIVREPSLGDSSRATILTYSLAAKNLAAHSRTHTPTALRSWLQDRLNDADQIIEVIEKSQIVDAAYYLEQNKDVAAANIDASTHYAQNGINESRPPNREIGRVSKQNLFANILAACDAAFDDQDLDKLLSRSIEAQESERRSKEALHRNTEISRISRQLQNRTASMCVVAHIFYSDLCQEILEQVAQIPGDFDLIVSTPTWGNTKIKKLTLDKFPDAVFYEAPNCGRDIGPFLDLLPAVLEKNYTAILKIQTKKGHFENGKIDTSLGDIWRKEMLAALTGGRLKIQTILDAFETNPKLNMVGPRPYLVPINAYPPHDGGNLASQLIPGIDTSTEGQFFAGTMFWVRPSCLAPLVSCSALNTNGFTPGTGGNDGELAHLVERVFGQLATANGGVILTSDVSPDCTVLRPPAENPQPITEHLRAARQLHSQSGHSGGH